MLEQNGRNCSVSTSCAQLALARSQNERQTEANPATLHLVSRVSSSGLAGSTLQYLVCLSEMGRAWEALAQPLLSWYKDQNAVGLLRMVLNCHTTDFTSFYM